MGPELRVFVLERCIINPAPVVTQRAVSLAAIFLPKLIEFGIGSVATLLKTAGADRTLQVTGSAFTDFFTANEKQALQVNREIGCVLAVYGTFDGADVNDEQPDDHALTVLRQRGYITSQSEVEIIFEGEVHASSDRTAFYVDTRHFSVRGLVGDKDRGERGFVLTLSVTSASASAGGDTIAVGNIDFGTLERGADLVEQGRAPDAHPQFRTNLMPWGQISAASKAAYDADFAGGVAAGNRYMPVTLGVTITQTEKGHPFLVKLGELLDGAKQEAATAISKLVLPEERAKAETEHAEAAEKLYEKELEAELKVREAQRDYDAGSADKPILRVKLEMAKRKRDRAVELRTAAGLPDRPAVPHE